MAELVSEADVKIDTTALTPAQAQFADCRVFWGREWADAVLRPRWNRLGSSMACPWTPILLWTSAFYPTRIICRS